MEANEIKITQEQYKMMQKLLAKEEKQKAYSRKQTVKNQIILEKAKAQGISATKQEIDARLAKEECGVILNSTSKPVIACESVHVPKETKDGNEEVINM